MVNGDRRLRAAVRRAIADPETSLHVSAVIAFEFAELQQRRRIPISETLDEIAGQFELTFEPLPSECWRLASQLPHIHGDPIDRMAVAHAILAGYVLATADANIRRYPVETI
ncbi:MAG: type II toxin-antitoxin system VapC family toxin [Sphingomonadaceae bacterium]